MITLYNVKSSALNMILIPDRHMGLLEFAPSMSVGHRGKIQKGEKVFDWHNKIPFAIYTYEVGVILNSIGTKSNISILHSPSGDTSQKMTILSVDSTNPDAIKLHVTYKDNTGVMKKCGYVLRRTNNIDEIFLFKKFLNLIIDYSFRYEVDRVQKRRENRMMSYPEETLGETRDTGIPHEKDVRRLTSYNTGQGLPRVIPPFQKRS